MILTLKQTQALCLLEDHENPVSEINYGGGAGGGKSALGCYWLAKSCLRYPGSRWLMGREELKNLKETTLNTFWDVLRLQQVPKSMYYYYEQKGIIQWRNGSEILLKELKHQPSDPDYDALGSLEITGAFIDEIPRIRQKAWQIVKSRIRYRLDFYCHQCGRANHPDEAAKPPHTGNVVLAWDENQKPVLWRCRKCGTTTAGLRPKQLGSCNPSKSWVYSYFYKPSRDGSLPGHKAFIQSLLSDNKHATRHYRETLLTLDPASIERLLWGNWDYDDDPATLIDFARIADLFTNSYVAAGEPAITADAARFGKDKTVIGVWQGWRLVRVVTLFKQGTDATARRIRELATEYKVPMSRVVIDEDGVGGGVIDQLPGCRGFLNGSRPLPHPAAVEQARKEGKDPKQVAPDNYEHLKAQCYYLVAHRINSAGLYISEEGTTPEQREAIMEELGVVKRKDMDKDGKLRILSKEEIKELIGRSPDYSDMIAQREYLELLPPPPKPITVFQTFG
jgi:phage terminase large subunit